MGVVENTRSKQTGIYWTLLKWLAITDIGASIGDLLIWGVYDEIDDLPCLMNALFLQWFDWASAAWVACIAHHMFYYIARPNAVTEEANCNLMIAYHSFVWGTTVALSLLPLSQGFGFGEVFSAYGTLYGFDGNWCWVSASAPSWWSLILFYIPLWVAEIFIIIVVIMCRIKLRNFMESSVRASGTEAAQSARDMYRHLLGYPLVLLCTWSVSSVRRIWMMFDESIVLNTAFTCAQIALISLAGFFNYVIFLYSHPKALQRNDVGSHAVQRARITFNEIAKRYTRPSGNDRPSSVKTPAADASQPPAQPSLRVTAELSAEVSPFDHDAESRV